MKKNFVTKVVAGHRITIPKAICEVLQIEKGDLVDVDIKKILVRTPPQPEVKIGDT